jgi:hypothetical protein
MPYLEGLRAVNAAPNLSVAFEDSRSGMRAPGHGDRGFRLMATSISD